MKTKIILLMITTAFVAFFVGKSAGLSNQELVYGSSGFPKNCRALIAENIDGYEAGAYSADEALFSINRNCGRYGGIWNEK